MITYVIFQTIIITYIFYVKVIVLLCDAVSVNAVCNFLYQEYKIPSNKTTISTKKIDFILAQRQLPIYNRYNIKNSKL